MNNSPLKSIDRHTTHDMDCDPPSKLRFFNDPEELQGRMTKAMMVVLVVVAVVTVVINLGVIAKLVRLFRGHRNLKPPFYFIGNLAASDFLLGFYVVFVFCLDLSAVSVKWRNKWCGLLTAIEVAACQETICSIMLIAVDKYIFICHGLSYPSIVTRKRSWIAIGASWAASILIGLLPLFGLHEDNWCACNYVLFINEEFSIIILVTGVLLPLSIIISLYSVILSLAIKVTRQKAEARSRSNTSGASSVIRLSIKPKLSKSSNRSKIISTSSSNSSNSNKSKSRDHTAVHQGKAPKHAAHHGNESKDSPSNAMTPLKELKYNKENSCPVIVELIESEIPTHSNTLKEDSIQSAPGKSDFTISIPPIELLQNAKRQSYDVTSPHPKGLFNPKGQTNPDKICLQSYKTYKNDDNIASTELQPLRKLTPKQRRLEQQQTFDSIINESEDDSGEVADDRRQSWARKNWTRKSYYKRVAMETRDKVQFLQKCKAVKAILLIVFCFTITYVPFVFATFSFKLQKQKNETLFKAINNLLYIAVVVNSLLNPFVYAYGYKEFRVKTQQFKGIFARDKHKSVNN